MSGVRAVLRCDELALPPFSDSVPPKASPPLTDSVPSPCSVSVVNRPPVKSSAATRVSEPPFLAISIKPLASTSTFSNCWRDSEPVTAPNESVLVPDSVAG